MRRREFITLLGGAAAHGRSRRARSSRSGCGASACSGTPRTIRKDGTCGVPAGPARIAAGSTAATADRQSLGRGRPIASQALAAELVRACSRRHPGTGGIGSAAVAAAATPHRPDRVRDVAIRSAPVSSQPGAARRQRHWVHLFEYDLTGKWLELLKEIAPGVTRAAVFADPANHRRHRPVRRHPGRGTVARGRGEPGQRSRRRRDRARGSTGFARPANGGLIVTASALRRSSRSDHQAGGRTSCRRSTSGALTSMRGGLISYGPISSTSSGARPATSIAFSRARSRPTCRCRRRPSTSW